MSDLEDRVERWKEQAVHAQRIWAAGFDKSQEQAARAWREWIESLPETHERDG